MRRVVVLLLVIPALAGCVGGGDDTPDLNTPAANPDTTAWRTVVHLADGRVMTNDSYPGALPVVEQRMVASTSGFEPTIGVSPDGTAYYLATDPVLQPGVYRSDNQGDSWAEVTPTIVTGVEWPPLSNDPFLETDPVTGRVFVVHYIDYVGSYGMHFECLTVQWSDDDGATWQRSMAGPCFPEDPPAHDHESLTTGVPRGSELTEFPRMVYYCVNPSEAPTGAVCASSRDGGATFGEPVATGLDDCFGLTGQIRAGPQGRLFLGQVDCDDGTGKVTIAISEDEGASWTRHVVHEGLGVPDLGEGIGALLSHEADVEVDSAGNVYVLWLDGDARPRLALSPDHGKSWSTSMNVTRPGVEVARFPSLVAGDAGRVAFQYLGRPGPAGPDAPWNAYVGFILDAQAESPVIATTTANAPEDPMHRGECNDRCQATMSNPPSPMGDFLDMDIDPTTGAVWTALVDLCPASECHSQADAPIRLQQGAAVGVQAAGSTLREGGDP